MGSNGVFPRKTLKLESIVMKCAVETNFVVIEADQK